MEKRKSIMIIVSAVASVAISLFLLFGREVDRNFQETGTAENEPTSAISVQEVSINVEPESFDFGTVVYGDVSRKEFSVTNKGTESIDILKISTSCGCTKAFMEKETKVIGPGESAKLIVTFDPAVHKDDTDVGEITRVVYIKTTDEINPETEINLQANVIKN